MTGGALITFLQALQLVALAPSIFIIFFLLLTARDLSRSAVPVLYFAALCCSFALPLLEISPSWSHMNGLRGALLFGESFSAALSYLLIMQFLLGRTPSPSYWLILALPGIGGAILVYGSVYVDEVCITEHICVASNVLKTLYGIFSGSLIFLLLMMHFISREDALIPANDPHRAHKFWLIMALIMLALLLLAVDLAVLLERITPDNAQLIATVIRLTFIYLVLTSLFRVFDTVFEVDMSRLPTASRMVLNEKDHAHIGTLTQFMEGQKMYREMGLNRPELANRLQVGEHVLSRLINVHFGKNFNEYVNGYRVDEAKQRLASENVSVTVVAFEVGFASIASFNRVFKEMVGCSPTEYRTGTAKTKPT